MKRRIFVVLMVGVLTLSMATPALAVSDLPVSKSLSADVAAQLGGKTKAKTVVSVWAPGLFYWKVTLTGRNAPEDGNVMGQYIAAKKSGRVAFIAHDYNFTGTTITWLSAGDEVIVTYEDGSVETLVVKEVRTVPKGNKYDMFNKTYKNYKYSFQTCAENGAILYVGLSLKN